MWKRKKKEKDERINFGEIRPCYICDLWVNVVATLLATSIIAGPPAWLVRLALDAVAAMVSLAEHTNHLW